MTTDIGHWEFHKDFDIQDWTGFIYKITHLPTSRQYIGKKFFFSKIRKKIKNRTNRKCIIKEAAWRNYTGSSNWLNSEIELFGKENFKFEIQSLHESRSSLAYREIELLILENALRLKLPDGTKAFYNGMIPPVKFIVKDETQMERDYRR